MAESRFSTHITRLISEIPPAGEFFTSPTFTPPTARRASQPPPIQTSSSRLEPIRARKAPLYRFQLPHASQEQPKMALTGREFPQLAPPKLTTPGLWINTASIHAAIDLPDPSIAEKVAEEAEQAKIKELISMYKDVVHLPDL